MSKEQELLAATALTPLDTPLSAELEAQAAIDAGLGVSTKSEDQQISLLAILQANSPPCDKRGAGHLLGAEPGHWHLRGDFEHGTKGIIVQHCGMARGWIEWLPNRQAFVARHPQRPSDAETRIVKGDGGRERPSWVRRSNGNVLQETRELFLLVDGRSPFMFSCVSTFHSFARELNSYLLQITDPKTGLPRPSFMRRFRLYTVPASNQLGHWFKPAFQDLGFVSAAEYQTARVLAKIVERGLQRVEMPINDDEGATAIAGAPGQASAA